VADWNDVAPTARFKPGQTIVVMVPGKSATRVAAAKAPAKRATKSAPATRGRVAQAAR
jgi:hypothetical protein